jgi:hypothetical protein
MMMEEADSSATTVHLSTKMMKPSGFSKTTVHSSTLTMQALDPSENMVQTSKAIQRDIAKHSNMHTILPCFAWLLQNVRGRVKGKSVLEQSAEKNIST